MGNGILVINVDVFMFYVLLTVSLLLILINVIFSPYIGLYVCLRFHQNICFILLHCFKENYKILVWHCSERWLLSWYVLR